MDRHELDKLTRDELLAMARSAGLDGAEWLSREELVAALAQAGLPRPRGLFDRARALLDKARELGTKLRPSRPPEPPPPPLPVTPSGTTGFDTLTMAEVYAAQGHVEEARRIAQAILLKDPSNAAAAALLARLPTPSDEVVPPPPAAYDEDVVGLVLLGPATLFAYWEVTGEGRARAQARVGDGARLVLRHLTATAEGGVTHDLPVEAIGERVLEPVRAGARHRAAVGLLDGAGRFVPIAHSTPVSTPPAGPSADTRLEWVDTALAPPSPEPRRTEPGRAVPAELRTQGQVHKQLVATAEAAEHEEGTS